MDAKPALDSSLNALPAVTGGKTDKERHYSIKLVKSGGLKLGLDVDYMAERSVLPIMSVTGGVAEKWNQDNPEMQIRKGDSIVEVNGTTGDVAQMLDKCKTDVELELTLCRCLNYDHLVADLEKLISAKNCGPIMIRLSWHDAGVFNGADGCPNAAMRLAGSGEHSLGRMQGCQKWHLHFSAPSQRSTSRDLFLMPIFGPWLPMFPSRQWGDLRFRLGLVGLTHTTRPTGSHQPMGAFRMGTRMPITSGAYSAPRASRTVTWSRFRVHTPSGCVMAIARALRVRGLMTSFCSTTPISRTCSRSRGRRRRTGMENHSTGREKP